jgi:hypothetical protein
MVELLIKFTKNNFDLSPEIVKLTEKITLQYDDRCNEPKDGLKNSKKVVGASVVDIVLSKWPSYCNKYWG